MFNSLPTFFEHVHLTSSLLPTRITRKSMSDSIFGTSTYSILAEGIAASPANRLIYLAKLVDLDSFMQLKILMELISNWVSYKLSCFFFFFFSDSTHPATLQPSFPLNVSQLNLFLYKPFIFTTSHKCSGKFFYELKIIYVIAVSS